MGRLVHALGASIASALVACSLVTSWDGLPLGASDADTGTDEPSTKVDASTKVDTGRDPDRPPDGGSSSGDLPETGTLPEDASTDVEAGPSGCPAGIYRCGSRVGGAANDLYQCTAGGPVKRWTCSRGCTLRDGGPETNDVCGCFPGGSYCGEDQVIGDPKTLYECKADFTGKLLRVCPDRCVINPGSDDSCQ